MPFVPTFKLYDSSGDELQYTFTAVQDANYPHSEKDFIEHTSQRGKGSVIIDGGEKAWDLTIRFVISGTDYEDLTDEIDDLESDIDLNVPYVLKIDKTNSTTYDYNVKRILPIEYPIESNLRNTFQEVIITFRVNSW
jgi:hypothetical protein